MTGTAFGLDLADLTDELRKKHNINDAVTGILITGAPDVVRHFVGTVISKVNDAPVSSLAEVLEQIQMAKNTTGKYPPNLGARLSIYAPDGRNVYTGFRYF